MQVKIKQYIMKIPIRETGSGFGGNGMIKYVVNNSGITNFPVRNIYYYIIGMGWDYSFFMLLDRILWGKGVPTFCSPFSFLPFRPFPLLCRSLTPANLRKCRI